MQIETITISYGPTLKVGDDYLKAQASVTVRLDEKEIFENALEEATDLLKKSYRVALLQEISQITIAEKTGTLKRLARYLRNKINGADDE